MNILAIPSLIFGFFFIFLAGNAYMKIFYHKKPDYPQLHYITIFVLCSLGIIYVLSAIIGNIAPAILATLTLPLLSSLYRKKKYPSFDSHIKEKYPEKYARVNAPISIWKKIGLIIGYLFFFITAIISLIHFLK